MNSGWLGVLGRMGFGGTFAIVLVSAGAAGCDSDSQGGDRICTLIGCGPIATWDLVLAGTFEEIRTSTLSVCRNATCNELALSALGPPANPNEQASSQLPERLDVTLVNREPSWDLHLIWWTPAPPHVDGDTYVIRVTDASGMAIGTISQTADYSEFYPNGRECDVTPCVGAELR